MQHRRGMQRSRYRGIGEAGRGSTAMAIIDDRRPNPGSGQEQHKGGDARPRAMLVRLVSRIPTILCDFNGARVLAFNGSMALHPPTAHHHLLCTVPLHLTLQLPLPFALHFEPVHLHLGFGILHLNILVVNIYIWKSPRKSTDPQWTLDMVAEVSIPVRTGRIRCGWEGNELRGESIW